MKKTKKQYLPQVQRRNGVEEDKWLNATYRAHNCSNSPYYDKGSSESVRYASSLEEAKRHIEWCIEEFSPKHSGEVSHMRAGMIGISSVLDEGTRSRLEVVKWRIKVREVTEWEEIEL